MGIKMRVVKVALIVFSLFFLGQLSADTDKVYTGITDTQKMETSPAPTIEVPSRPEIKVETDKKVRVEKFVISGNKNVSTDELLNAISKYKGKDLSIQQLMEIADIITRKYWEKGYITSFAYIPVQKMERGILEIEVVEGRPGNIIVKNNKYYTEKFIIGYFNKVSKKEILNNKDIERALLLLNEFPKLSVNATLTKGSSPATTDIILNVSEKMYPMNFGLFYNNFGSRYTGEHRVGFNWDWANITKNGDVLSLTGVTNIEDFDQMWYWKAGYSIPIGYDGLKVGADYSKMSYKIGKELKILGIEGEAEVFGIDVSYPLIRARDKNLSVSGGIRHKTYENFLFEKTYTTSNDYYSVFELGASGDRFLGKRNHIFYTLKTTMGLEDMFGGMDDDEYTTSSRPGITDGGWAKLNIDLTNITKIADSVQLITRASGQIANDNLLTSEQFAIGGPDTVRGYPSGEYLGDYGYLLSAELRTPIVPGATTVNKYANLAFFGDYGRTYFKDELPGDKEGELASVGVGLRIYLPCTFNMRFDAAYPVSSADASDGDDWRYWINMSWGF